MIYYIVLIRPWQEHDDGENWGISQLQDQALQKV